MPRRFAKFSFKFYNFAQRAMAVAPQTSVKIRSTSTRKHQLKPNKLIVDSDRIHHATNITKTNHTDCYNFALDVNSAAPFPA